MRFSGKQQIIVVLFFKCIPPFFVFSIFLCYRGLQYLREKHQIIHRDVKPSNILGNLFTVMYTAFTVPILPYIPFI